jgi:hypothetical protein
MDETLRIIRQLYDEEPDEDDLERRLDRDPALRREREALREVKDHLDCRAPKRPSPSTIDDIVAHAGEAARRSHAAANGAADREADRPAARPDREASSSSRSISRRLQAVAGVLGLVLVTALGWWQIAPDAPDTLRSPSAEATAPNSIAPRSVDGLPPAVRDLPEWDEGDDVVRLHRRLEVVNARSRPPSAWDDRPALVPADQVRP